jgi:uncharacterized protein (DUF4415 family)
MTDDEIDTSDIPPVTEEMFRRGTWRNVKTVRVTLDVDSGILSWYKGHGEGWERLMRAALRDYLLAHLEDEQKVPPP